MQSTLDIFGTFPALQLVIYEGYFNIGLFVHNHFFFFFFLKYWYYYLKTVRIGYFYDLLKYYKEVWSVD